jgi:hypothetical protein
MYSRYVLFKGQLGQSAEPAKMDRKDTTMWGICTKERGQDKASNGRFG